jgi:hypothetical protein
MIDALQYRKAACNEIYRKLASFDERYLPAHVVIKRIPGREEWCKKWKESRWRLQSLGTIVAEASQTPFLLSRWISYAGNLFYYNLFKNEAEIAIHLRLNYAPLHKMAKVWCLECGL